jgi:hypothetical protein
MCKETCPCRGQCRGKDWAGLGVLARHVANRAENKGARLNVAARIVMMTMESIALYT